MFGVEFAPNELNETVESPYIEPAELLPPKPADDMLTLAVFRPPDGLEKMDSCLPALKFEKSNFTFSRGTIGACDSGSGDFFFFTGAAASLNSGIFRGFAGSECFNFGFDFTTTQP